ncbi:MurR/RpiR family transcriptional regulator [Psychromicrobium lacuslunae]|uniref:RpiR family transcriptional regulator n=1 Tax=Psychromicrobium lacuslunae TaxID=1618207 RepID=A0A0D4C2T9_9MICC|nr:MurR/RpiR family transcriptional regulator [Psychromicrobium lacuslunae]AJT42705.1 RpiR family transcriptional regulator [Psychromicrobium lacuslunae]
MSIQSTIYSLLPSLPPAARRIGELIVAEPAVVLQSTISELAKRCQTSDPSVVRFCRTLGFTGYVQLRLALATEIGREIAAEPNAPQFGEDISPADSLGDSVEKLRFTEVMAIEETLKALDLEQLNTAAERIDGSSRVLLYGVGAGAVVAEDFAYKLSRIGRIAQRFADLHGALMAAALARPGDVAVLFSHSGQTPEIMQFLRAVKQRGVKTIAVSNVRQSALAKEADHCLLTMVRETEFRAGAMASRIAQLAIVDCLFVAVAQRSYQPTVTALELTRQAIEQQLAR